MSLGVLGLIVLSMLLYFELAEEVLVPLGITETTALVLIGLSIAGSFITVPLIEGYVDVALNLGGMVPLFFVFALFYYSPRKERKGALLASLGTALLTFSVSRLWTLPPFSLFDPLLLFGLLAGTTGYLLGRTKRASLFGAVTGLIFTDLAHLIGSLYTSRGVQTVIGGQGVFDAMILALITALFFSLVMDTEKSKGERKPYGVSEHVIKQKYDTELAKDENKKEEDTL